MINIENTTFAIGTGNTVAVFLIGILIILFLLFIKAEDKFPNLYNNLSNKIYERIFFGFIFLIVMLILFLIMNNFLPLFIGWIIGSLLAIAWSRFMYNRIYKYRLYKILGLLEREEGVGLWFPVEHIFRKLKKEYPKKYKNKKFRDLEIKLREYLDYLVDDGIAEKNLGIKLADDEKIGGHRSWHYRRKPGFEFKSKSKKWWYSFLGKFT